MASLDPTSSTALITGLTSIILAVIGFFTGKRQGRKAEKKSLEKDLKNVPR